jgi:hypothetical protein
MTNSILWFPMKDSARSTNISWIFERLEIRDPDHAQALGVGAWFMVEWFWVKIVDYHRSPQPIFFR